VIEFFVHPDRVSGVDEAAALARALGADRVRMTQHRTRAWALHDPPAIQRVLRAVEPESHTTIDLEGITREATLPFLERLVRSSAHFISLTGIDATVRAWRGDAFVDQIAIDRTLAFERVRASVTLTWINGSVSNPDADAVACLPGLFAELDQPELEIDLDVALDSAVALVRAHPEDELEWTGGAVFQFPGGEISTYKLKPPPDFETGWRNRVTSALATIRG
jgi:hypothetical protein